MKNLSSVPKTQDAINKQFCINEYYFPWLHTLRQLYLSLTPFSVVGSILSNKYNIYKCRVHEETTNFLITYFANVKHFINSKLTAHSCKKLLVTYINSPIPIIKCYRDLY